NGAWGPLARLRSRSGVGSATQTAGGGIRELVKRWGGGSGCSAAVRYGEGRSLLSLERDLLRQHDVANSKSSLGKEAPDRHPHTALVQLLDVHLSMAVNAAIGAHYLKTPHLFILFELCWRKPSLEQCSRFLLSFSIPRPMVIQIEHNDKRKEQTQYNHRA